MGVFRAHTSTFWERIKSVPASEPSPADFWSVVESRPALRDHLEVVFARRGVSDGSYHLLEHGMLGTAATQNG